MHRVYKYFLLYLVLSNWEVEWELVSFNQLITLLSSKVTIISSSNNINQHRYKTTQCNLQKIQALYLCGHMF